MKRKIILQVLLFALSFSISGQYTWKNVQINGGGFVPGVIFNETEQGLVYARTDIGGAYRWDPDNSLWIPLTDHLPRAKSQHMGVLSLATDPVDPDRVYLAVGEYTAAWAIDGAILASTDRGETWTEYPIAAGVKLGGNENGRSAGERLQVDPNKNNVLFLGTSRDGVWKSTNYGATWTKLTGFPSTTSGISFILFDKSSGTSGTETPVIYAGILRNSSSTTKNFYKSTDGGATWTEVADQPLGARPHHAALASDGNIYLAYSNATGPNGVSSGFVYKYDGTTWTNITPPTPSGYCNNKGYAGISVSAQDPDFIAVSSLNCWWPHEMIFRSTDGGVNWTEVGVGNSSYDHSKAPYSSAQTPHWVGDIDIDPFDKNNVWFVTGYGLWHTADFSNTTTVPWVFDNVGLEETAVLQLITPPSGAPLLSVLGDIDGFKHDNLNVSPPARFSLKGTNRSIDFAENNPSFMVKAFDASPYGAYSANGGSSWTDFTSFPAGATGSGQIAVSADGSTILWRPNGTTGMYYSTNNGNSWTASAGISGTLDPVADRVNPAKFYVFDDYNGAVYVSEDGAATFNAGATGLGGSWDVWFSEITTVFGYEGHIWLAGYNGGLRYSTNSGQNFTLVGDGVTFAYRVAVGKKEPSASYPTIYFYGTRGGIEGIFRSVNMGAGWTRINDDKHRYGVINDLAADRNIYGRVYLGTEGRGIIYGDDQSVISSTDKSDKLILNLVNIFPNPSRNSFFIDLNPGNEPADLDIINIYGEFVKSYRKVTGILETGEEFPQGIYFVKIIQGTSTGTVKIIKE
jgi:hypothetical protein